MKRLLWGLSFALLLGCPLYDEDCSGGQDCAAGFACDSYRQRCVPLPTVSSCARPEECGASETCTPDGVCRPGSCDYHGCVAGYTCSIVEGVHTCAASGASATGQDAGTTPDEGDAGASGDASPGTDAAVTPDSTPDSPDSGTPDASSDAG